MYVHAYFFPSGLLNHAPKTSLSVFFYELGFAYLDILLKDPKKGNIYNDLLVLNKVYLQLFTMIYCHSQAADHAGSTQMTH
jgi:hypothetical protein